MLKFLSKLWLLASASVRAFEISKGRGGGRRGCPGSQGKYAGRPLPRFPAKTGCPAAAQGSYVLSALTEPAAVSPRPCVNINLPQNTAGLLSATLESSLPGEKP